MTPSLSELQKQFVAGLKNQSQAILNHIESKENFAIYQNSITGALQNILKELYPVCLKLVGDDFFIAMADHYILKTPSSSSNISDYGNYFADFIINFPPADPLPYLADTAKLERAWQTAFHAAHAKPLDFQALSAVEENEHIIFTLPPGSTLLSSSFPIHQIWEANQETYHGEENIVLIDGETYYFLVWQAEFETLIDLLTPEEWQTLSWIEQRFTLSEICEKLSNTYPTLALTDLLPHLAYRRWLSGFEIKQEG